MRKDLAIDQVLETQHEIIAIKGPRTPTLVEEYQLPYFSFTYLAPVPEPLSVGSLVSLSEKSQLLRYPVPALRYVAKLNQPRYGAMDHAATGSTCDQMYVRYPTVPVRATLWTVASMGRFKTKKRGIHIRLRPSWMV